MSELFLLVLAYGAGFLTGSEPPEVWGWRFGLSVVKGIYAIQVGLCLLRTPRDS
jgi:hypothetical protein